MTVSSVLLVCMGNIYRSPMALEVLEEVLDVVQVASEPLLSHIQFTLANV